VSQNLHLLPRNRPKPGPGCRLPTALGTPLRLAFSRNKSAEPGGWGSGSFRKTLNNLRKTHCLFWWLWLFYQRNIPPKREIAPGRHRLPFYRWPPVEQDPV